MRRYEEEFERQGAEILLWDHEGVGDSLHENDHRTFCPDRIVAEFFWAYEIEAGVFESFSIRDFNRPLFAINVGRMIGKGRCFVFSGLGWLPSADGQPCTPVEHPVEGNEIRGDVRIEERFPINGLWNLKLGHKGVQLVWLAQRPDEELDRLFLAA